jgi:CheY-like chemotaxis protein
MTRTLRSVLHIDDEPDIREIVQVALSFAGDLRIYTGETGEQAATLARELRPDLVLLDVMMPGLDGPGVLKRMRAEPATRRIPVIFMTAKAMPQEIAVFRELGAIGVIAKPFEPMQLAQQVLSLWHAHNQAIENDLTILATQLGKKFLQRTKGETVILRELIERAYQGDSTVMSELRHLGHKINGTGSTFGFASVSGCGREIEHLIERRAERSGLAEGAIDSALLKQLMECTERLTVELEVASEL